MSKITKEFLKSMGWVETETYPLLSRYTHSGNSDLILSAGEYGMFSIVELHWLNKTPERVFSTLGKDLTIWDYMNIIRLLGIQIKGEAHEIKPKAKTDIEKAVYLLREIEAFLSFSIAPPEGQLQAMKKTIKEFVSTFPHCWECGDVGYTGYMQDHKCKKCNNLTQKSAT